MLVYGQSKLASLLFTAELQRRLTAAGSPVLATAAHPGYAATNLVKGPAKWYDRAGMAMTTRLSAQDMGAARRLWDASEQLTGVRFPLGAPAAVQV